MLVGFKHRLLLDNGGIGKVRVGFAGYCGTVDVKPAIALAGIVELAAVFAPCQIGLPFWGVGDLLGGLVVDGCHKYFAAAYEGNLLAVGRSHSAASRHSESACRIGIIDCYIDGNLRGLRARTLGVDLAIVGIGHCAVGAY